MTTVLSTLGELILGKVKQPELGGLGGGGLQKEGRPRVGCSPQCLGLPLSSPNWLYSIYCSQALRPMRSGRSAGVATGKAPRNLRIPVVPGKLQGLGLLQAGGDLVQPGRIQGCWVGGQKNAHPFLGLPEARQVPKAKAQSPRGQRCPGGGKGTPR